MPSVVTVRVFAAWSSAKFPMEKLVWCRLDEPPITEYGSPYSLHVQLLVFSAIRTRMPLTVQLMVLEWWVPKLCPSS